MKKIFLAIAILLGCGALYACGGGKDGTTTTKTTVKKTVNLTYATWGNMELEQKMIDAFMDEYPHINVLLDTSIEGDGRTFTTNLIAASLAGTLPDVFAIDNVPFVMSKGLVKDLSPYWNLDQDAAKVYPNIAKTAYYGGKRFAAPSYQFSKGIFVNKTLIDTMGLDVPSYDWTYDDMIGLAKSVKGMTNEGKKIFGLNGFFGYLDFEKIMPQQDDTSLQYNGWTGTSFKFETDLYIKYLDDRRKMELDGTMENLTAEEKENIYGNSAAWPFAEGDVLMGIDGSWNVVNHITNTFEPKQIDVDFYPYPRGTKGQFIPSILDYMCVSSQTNYPQEAFELLKFMSFGEKGWQARIKIMEEMDLPFTMFPVAEYDGVWDTILTKLETSKYPGLYANALLMSKSVPDSEKWIPGIPEFYDFLAAEGENKGYDSMTAVQLASEYQKELNRIVDEAYALLQIQK